jgi:hypothetical protein
MQFPIEKFKKYKTIKIGSLIPHIFVRSSGMGKAVIPGLSDYMQANFFHSQDSETASEIMKILKDKYIDYSVVNTLNRNGQTCNITINGTPACMDSKRMSKYLFGAKLEKSADVVILEPLLKTKDFMQCINVLRLCKYPIVKEFGEICIKCNPEDGIGVHYLFQPLNGFNFNKFDKSFNQFLNKKTISIICSNINESLIRECFSKYIAVAKDLKAYLEFRESFIRRFTTEESIVHYVGADIIMPE